jgi:hypothetical protein
MSYAKHSMRFLTEARHFRVTPEISSGLVVEFFEALDCPRSLAAALLFKYGEHEQLANLECNPLEYLTVQEFRDAYAATKFLSKFKDLVLDYDLDEEALKKFDKFELLCSRTNARFRKLESDSLYRGQVVRLHQAVQRKISNILGEFGIEEFFATADWGPGATTLIKSFNASATNKFQCETGITRDLYDLLPSALLSEVYPAWVQHISGVGFPNFQVGNKIVTVPKDATANRVIAVEPGLNLWFQLAIGTMIQRRLLRCGIDLRDQSQNQRLAYTASKDTVNATIDFSSASDSISSEVIRELFVNCSYSERSLNNLSTWFSVMDSCRSHYGLRGEAYVRWSKFSSMGNGFTFGLESLLFFAIAKCCAEEIHRVDPNAGFGDVSVYGDDVIIPRNCLELFSTMCEFYGFVINVKKSHFSSLFRESCGSHYMAGVCTKPVFLKEHLTDVLSVYRLANSIRRFAHRGLCSMGCEARFRTLFESIVNLVPKPLRVRIPETLGDGGFISSWDEAIPAHANVYPLYRAKRAPTVASVKERRLHPDRIKRMNLGFEGYYVWQAAEVGKTYQSEGTGLLLDRLWLIQKGKYYLKQRENADEGDNPVGILSTQERRNTVALRDRTKLRFSRSLVQQWYSLGPWI